ncbi:hypothetical protein EHO98_20420 [Leptospira stimsonii]|uniref:Uncharacterized protein n=1 Tax=Leptospira stimsonii TaxID=2202203 RepID=A0A4R9L320_9LEPT|nr:hypothetical protein DLM78_00805 [Leptospira stimsonii]TGK10927.1 hypothetical protein EHO98_20420 [Leptospira stimsonii]TGM09830.1 hypothetical protein EHQ90_20465 [Leptospira stimsonii]
MSPILFCRLYSLSYNLIFVFENSKNKDSDRFGQIVYLYRTKFIVLIFQKFVTIRIRKNYKLQKIDSL